MKTCPSCHTKLEDDVKFCTNCGAKQEEETSSQTKICPSCLTAIPFEAKFCPHCATEQPEQDRNDEPGVYDEVDLRELSISCGYSYESPNAISGTVVISPIGIVFESSSKGVLGLLTTLATFGQKTRMAIAFKNITHMSIMERGYSLYIRTSDGGTHYFWGMSMSKAKVCVKKLAYIFELYRRMYWYYGEYTEGAYYLSTYVEVGSFKKSVQDMSSVSDEELIQFFRTV